MDLSDQRVAVIGTGASAYQVVPSIAGPKRPQDRIELNSLKDSFLGLLQAPATKIAQVVIAPAGKLARVVQAYASKDEAA